MDTLTLHGITYDGSVFAADRNQDRVAPTDSHAFEATATADRLAFSRSLRRAQRAKLRRAALARLAADRDS